jgi:hypothetical protein
MCHQRLADAEVFRPAPMIAVCRTLPRPRDQIQGQAALRGSPPIFARGEKGLGYELLFPDDMENAFHGGDADVASPSTLDSSPLAAWTCFAMGAAALF